MELTPLALSENLLPEIAKLPLLTVISDPEPIELDPQGNFLTSLFGVEDLTGARH
jgi:hypothetical protein